MRRTCPAGGVGWHWEFDIVNRAISTTTLRLLTLAVAALALLVVPASQVTAQLGEDEEPTYTLRILAVEHDPAGSLAISVRVAGVTDLEPPRFTSLVDGIPQRVDATPTRDVDTLAIVLAIDTSGSMAGAPIEAARDAAISLIDQLNEGDEVAIVRFSNNVSLALDFTTDRAVARDVLNSLVAQGETALYDASAFTADLLSDISPARSNLVLLSDGEESGASAAARDASIQSLTDSGVTAFAFGLGTSSDAEYLEAVAAGTGGEFWEVADDGALGSLFSSLGGRLGATDLVQVVTRPFAIGTHTADIFATVLGERLEARAEFEVTNEGFVEISAVEGGEPGDPITVIATTLVDPAVLRLEATAGGQSLAFGSGTSLTIDPWRFGPGSLLIDVRANVSAGLVGSATFELVVPTLSPTLTIEQQPEATSVTVRQRVQGPGESTIVIRDGGEELASSSNSELLLELPRGTGDLTIELLDAEGGVLATESISSLPALEPSSSPPWMPILAVVTIVALVGLLWYRRRDNTPRPTPLRVRAPRRVAPQTPPRDIELGTLTVVASDGTERAYRMGPRPVTIGRASSCDIVLDDPDVRPMHARISADPGGQFRIHGLSSRGVPYQQQQRDEWLIVAAGEEVAIASYVIRMDAVQAVAS